MNVQKWNGYVPPISVTVVNDYQQNDFTIGFAYGAGAVILWVTLVACLMLIALRRCHYKKDNCK